MTNDMKENLKAADRVVIRRCEGWDRFQIEVYVGDLLAIGSRRYKTVGGARRSVIRLNDQVFIEVIE